MWEWKYWDVALAILGFLVQCGLAFMGLTMTHWKHKLEFVGLVLIGLIFTGFAVERGVDAADKLQAQLNTIQHNTETPPPPPIINVNPPSPAPPQQRADVALYEVSGGIKQSVNGIPTGVTAVYRLGETAAINIYFVNSGTADADMDGAAKIYLVPERSEKIEKVLTADFTKFVMHRTPTPSPLQHGGQSGYWFSGQSEKIITQEDIDKLKNGTTILYLYFEVEYKDPAGHHYQHYCRWAQPSASEAEIIWHYCSDYADHG